MKTKNLITLLALLMAGMFVSAQTYMSDAEIVKYEQMIQKNAVAVETSTSPLGINLYDLFWGLYFANFSNEVYPTSHTAKFCDSKPKNTVAPTQFMPPAYNANDGESPYRSKMRHIPRYPTLNHEGTPYYGGSNNTR